MSWTVVDDNGVIQVRASIIDPKEMQELVECLTKRLREMPCDPIEKEKQND